MKFFETLNRWFMAVSFAEMAEFETALKLLESGSDSNGETKRNNHHLRDEKRPDNRSVLRM